MYKAALEYVVEFKPTIVNPFMDIFGAFKRYTVAKFVTAYPPSSVVALT